MSLTEDQYLVLNALVRARVATDTLSQAKLPEGAPQEALREAVSATSRLVIALDEMSEDFVEGSWTTS